MKRWILLLLCVVSLFGSGRAEAVAAGKRIAKNPFKWYTNLEKAEEEAKRSSRAILLVFSGSDWCGYCQILDKKVLATKEFKQYARKKVVPLLADFPRKAGQSAQMKADAAAIRAKYPVNGFPTYYLLDADGNVLYQGSGCSPNITPKQFIAKLDSALAKAAEKKQSVNVAAPAENVTVAANAAGLKWFTNLDEAKAEAKRSFRDILLVFSGSDWCGYCKILDRKVLATKEFKDYAGKRYVLLIADFPRKAQPEAVRKDAEAIMAQYPTDGFPTCYILNSNGKVLLKESGCSPDITPQKFIENLEKKLKK